MLSLLVVFVVNVVLLFVLFKASNYIFTLKNKPQFKKSPAYITVAAFLVLFLLSVIITFGSAKLIANIIPSAQLRASTLIVDLDSQDCPQLLDAVNLVKSETAKLANHRNIEETSPLFTVKLEYQKGAAKLQEAANIFEQLNLATNSKKYTQNITQKLQEKADYFVQRSNVKEDKTGTKQIEKLLKKMDRATLEQQLIFDNIERKCSI